MNNSRSIIMVCFECSWGHLLGDEGSAYWIAQRAIKRVFDHEDNLNLSPYDLTRLSDAIKAYFKVRIFSSISSEIFFSLFIQVQDMSQLLSYFYTNFQKNIIARFTQIIAERQYFRRPTFRSLIMFSRINSGCE